MRVIVTGSRKWAKPDKVFEALNTALQEMPAGENFTVIHGACPTGADSHASEWCRGWDLSGYPCEERWPADWKLHGRWAGVRRNKEMVDAGADLVLAFPLPEGKGTQQCMNYAAEKGIPVRNYGWLTESAQLIGERLNSGAVTYRAH